MKQKSNRISPYYLKNIISLINNKKLNEALKKKKIYFVFYIPSYDK